MTLKLVAAILAGFCVTTATAETLTPNPTPSPAGPLPSPDSFLNSFPQLKSYLYEEPKSGFYFGLGFSPVGMLNNQFMFTANFFELHYIKDLYDIEILNAAYSTTEGQSSTLQSQHFTFRAAPKIHIYGPWSAGPLIGYELVSYPNVYSVIYNNGLETSPQPFSSRGWVYGGMISETFAWGKQTLLKINELGYQESYSNTTTAEGWTYRYSDPVIQANPNLIKASTVLMIEASFLY